MRILVIGSGGRENAIVWKLSRSSRVEKIFAVPGNGGIYEFAECHPEIGYEKDFSGLIRFVREKGIDLTVVGPEDPLANGIADAFRKAGLALFGPGRNAAQMEASKHFAKKIMKEGDIPTARFSVFSDFKKAVRFLPSLQFPVVIKADGLAKGKGVFIVREKNGAARVLESIMKKKIFSSAGNKVLIEEFLEGEEVTVMAFTDGEAVRMMPASQDHKRLLDNDEGPNTGGMGAFAPVFLSRKERDEIEKRVFLPALRTLQKHGIVYRGVLYAGLIRTRDGFKVLEFNCRFGDPETQVILPLLRTDLTDIIRSVLDGKLGRLRIKWKKRKVLCVVAVSQGYPDHYEKGCPIRGLADARKTKGVTIFHAGTRIENNVPVTSGGRVLNVTAVSRRFRTARGKAYEALEKISYKGLFYRRDIGRKF